MSQVARGLLAVDKREADVHDVRVYPARKSMDLERLQYIVGGSTFRHGHVAGYDIETQSPQFPLPQDDVTCVSIWCTCGLIAITRTSLAALGAPPKSRQHT